MAGTRFQARICEDVILFLFKWFCLYMTNIGCYFHFKKTFYKINYSIIIILYFMEEDICIQCTYTLRKQRKFILALIII